MVWDFQVYVPQRENVRRPGQMVAPRTATMGSQRTHLPPVNLIQIQELHLHSSPIGGPPSGSPVDQYFSKAVKAQGGRG
jgi:hypothetical protein